jgi:hypothetical protein
MYNGTVFVNGLHADSECKTLIPQRGPWLRESARADRSEGKAILKSLSQFSRRRFEKMINGK